MRQSNRSAARHLEFSGRASFCLSPVRIEWIEKRCAESSQLKYESQARPTRI